MEELKKLVEMATVSVKNKGWHSANDKLIVAINTVNDMMDKSLCKRKVMYDK